MDLYLELGNYDNATSVPCQYGWEFDTEVYGPTATTQVNIVTVNVNFQNKFRILATLIDLKHRL